MSRSARRLARKPPVWLEALIAANRTVIVAKGGPQTIYLCGKPIEVTGWEMRGPARPQDIEAIRDAAGSN